MTHWAIAIFIQHLFIWRIRTWMTGLLNMFIIPASPPLVAFLPVCSEGGPIVMSDLGSHPDATLKKQTEVVEIGLLVVELNSHPS